MRGPYKRHSPETKLKVFELVEAGNTIAHAAKTAEVPYETAVTWVSSPEFAEFRRIKQQLALQSIESLTFRCLTAHLEAVTNYAKETATSQYIRKQNAADLAVLYNAIADRAFALLTALAQSNQRRGGAAETGLSAIPSGDATATVDS